MKILVINGPNLQLLGKREVDIYGHLSLENIESNLLSAAKSFKELEIDFYQSNHEGGIVDKIAEALYKKYDGIIINPAAYTHTSLAIYDAIKAVELPVVEIHISNINKREEYRKHSYIAPACVGQISGFGAKGYEYALIALVDYINNKK
ncbi:MAG: type II 3-dehydroquinate dehydratase [bacterium]|nr:type II 3-dehydroquinate dehydratase [bacterium]